MNAISDIHLSPGMLAPPLPRMDSVVLVGDIFNVLPHGMAAWRTDAGRRTVQSLLDQLPLMAVFILGNHEGSLADLRELVDEGFPCYRQYDTTINGKPYRFMHGHQFTFWRWLGIAPAFVEFVTTLPVLRGWWYRFCRWRGWMGGGTMQSNERYPEFVGRIWAKAMDYSHKHNVSLVIGHTHTPMHFEDDWVTVIDCGANEVTEL